MEQNSTDKKTYQRQRSALSSRRLSAATFLAAGAAATKAASASGVSRSTIVRWQADPDFIAEVERLSAELVSSLGRRIAQLSGKALDTLEEVLDDPAARRGERLRASAIIISNFASLRELAELELRVQELERGIYGAAKN